MSYVKVVSQMLFVRSVWAIVAVAFVATGTTLGDCQAGSAQGGYNSMDVNSVYHDNGRDSANARTMLAAITDGAAYYRHARETHAGVRFAGRAATPIRTAGRPIADSPHHR